MLEATAGDDSLLALDMGTDGSGYGLLTVRARRLSGHGGARVFRRAVRITVESATAALAQAGMAAHDVSLFVPHQANLRIIEAVASRLGIPMCAAPPSCSTNGEHVERLDPPRPTEAAQQRRLAPGDRVLLSGFGAGMAWASAVVRWDAGVARRHDHRRSAESVPAQPGCGRTRGWRRRCRW